MTTTPIELPARSRSAILAKASDLLVLTKPRMNLLVVGTTMVGFYMAARSGADWISLPAVMVGTALSAAGASVLNQLIERRRDALMPRTRNRPLPMGRFYPAEALGYGIGLAFCGVAILGLLVNSLTAILAAVTLISYLLIYTPLKPRTSWNTLVGAFPGALPPVMGWAAVRGHLSPEALALLLILFVWQIPHFMAIAILYRNDYAAAGFRMLPVVDRSLVATARHIIIFSLILNFVTLLPAFLGMAQLPYLLIAIPLGFIFLHAGMKCATLGSRPNARRLFLVSIIYLPLLLLGMMLMKK
jgi:protoheme IX farnesyltransferase